MIGILVVSHSAELARGVKALAEQMAKGQVPIAAAGGTHDGALGTSFDLIAAALDQLRGVDGVLVLVDMGSAVMSAELALEAAAIPFLLSGAPLVEGAVVAAVEASRPGATLSEVAAAAARALESKGLLDPTVAVAAPAPPAPPLSGEVAEVLLTIANPIGLHMRPAKDFVQTATRFSSNVRIRNLDRPERPAGNAKSMIDVLKLGVSAGQRVQVWAEGADAYAAVEALSRLAAANFREP
ncbi:MAG: PTS-dependent dihydroxyacetone kinase phosphotransferase subunit DhaM [Chloroflexi bacterium]|nr:PTS-dependent dihydroxyacetone kinase phosphotransferase subunit DhaM [Chloroflexota bacterium]